MHDLMVSTVEYLSYAVHSMAPNFKSESSAGNIRFLGSFGSLYLGHWHRRPGH